MTDITKTPEMIILVDDMKVVKEVPEDFAGQVSIASTAEQLSDLFSKEQLIKLRTNMRGKEDETDSKKSTKKLAFECFKEATKEVADKPGKPKKEKKERAQKEKVDKPPKEKKPSKMDTIRKELKEKGTVSRKELAALIGSDEGNTHTMISIMGNAKRTPEAELLFVSYNKTDGTYTLHENLADKEEAVATAAKLEAEEKSKAAEEAKAKAKAERDAKKQADAEAKKQEEGGEKGE